MHRYVIDELFRFVVACASIYMIPHQSKIVVNLHFHFKADEGKPRRKQRKEST
jgi:hypothetical protein